MVGEKEREWKGESDEDSEAGRGSERVSAENGFGGYCSVTLSRWKNKDIGGFNTVHEREA